MKYRFGTITLDFSRSGNHFYPPDLPKKDQLSYYATQFGAIEMDQTFYKLPSDAVVKKWRDSVPEDFEFGMKVPKTVSHMGGIDRLNTESSRATWRRLVELAEILGPHRTTLLVQFPASFRVKAFDEVRKFIEENEYSGQTMFEFRSDTWFTRETAELMRAHRVLWDAVDVLPDGEGDKVPGRDEVKYTPTRPVMTTDKACLRLCSGTYVREVNNYVDNTERLRWWLDQLANPAFPEGAPEVKETTIIVSDKTEAFALPTIDRLLNLLGLPPRVAGHG